MSEESKIEAITAKVQDRRAFVKTAAKVAVTAPAAALLLNASVKPAKAAIEPYGADANGGSADDFTYDPGDDGQDDVVFKPGDSLL